MARKKKQQRLLKKILVIGGTLAIVQVGFILYFSSQAPTISMKDEIARKVSDISGLPPERRERMKVQLALDDFRSKNGRLPKTLNELLPDYFDSVPKDPSTGKPFIYTVAGKRYTLGEVQAKAGAKPADSGLGGPPTAEEQAVLLASLENPVEDGSFVYSALGKRDPFQPFDFSVKANQDCVNHPLSCFDIGQLRYSSYLKVGDEPRAMVDDSTTGVGRPTRIGTKIGRNNGEVVEILPDKIVVVETLVDVTGQQSTRVVNLPLKPKVEGGKQPGRSTRR